MARQNIMRNLASMGMARLVSIGANAIATALIAQSLEPDSFGVYGLGASLAFFTLALQTGLAAYGAREVATTRDVRGTTNRLLPARLVMAFVSYGVVVAIVLSQSRPSVETATLLIMGMLPVLGAFDLSFVFQGLERMHISAARDAGTGLLMALGAVLLVHDPDDLPIAGGVFIGAFSLNVALLGTRYLREFGWPRLEFDRGTVMPILRAALPIGISHALLTFYYSFGILALAYMAEPATLGWYAAGHRVIISLLSGQYVVNQALYPVFSRHWVDRSNELKRLLNISLFSIFLISVILTATSIVSAPWLVAFLFGPGYDPTVQSLQVLCGCLFLMYNQACLVALILATGRSKDYLRASVAGLVTCLLLTPVGILVAGPLGAAAAWVVTELLVLVLLAFFATRQVRIGLWRAWFIPGAAAIALFPAFGLLQPLHAIIPYLIIFLALAVGLNPDARDFLRHRGEQR